MRLPGFFHPFGARAIRINGNLGALAIFFFRALIMIFHPKQFSAIVQQIYFIGAKSVQIVMLVGFFTGMVLGLQLYHVLVKFGSVGVLGTAVALSLIREMGPVLTAIMITARAGSAMTAEIGIQRISEQIDAIVETVKIALEQTPPELSADIVDRGIILTGGGALLKNLDRLIREETSLPVTVTEDPLSTVALGSGKALDNLEILKEVVIT